MKIGSDHSVKMVEMFQKLKFILKSQVYKGFGKHKSNTVYDYLVIKFYTRWSQQSIKNQ